jgi:uncharacterized protein
MDIILTDTEVRVLGSLMEKELSTPDYYPLSLNALINACNQKTSRNPVVSYDAETVGNALESLKKMGLVRESDLGRVPKYEECFTRPRNLLPRETSALCVLLLRGPQTSGEIRARTERLHNFETQEQVHEALNVLDEWGYVMKRPKQPGHKESRHVHLLSGEPEESAEDSGPPLIVRVESGKIEEMENEIKTLWEEIENMKQAFSDFRNQFE